MGKSLGFKIILFLALVQGIGGLLRAFNWVRIGVDLFGQGVLLLPFMAAMAVMRGMFVSGVAMLYVLFVVGALLGKSWAKWFCLTAVIINLLLVLSGLIQGAFLLDVIVWSAIPVILLFYLFSQTGRDALKGV